ncbi:MAG: ATP-binding cassette domain-containing protein [Acidaminococcaceae bacterium]
MIKINNLTKKFGNRVAVDKLSLEIKAGEIFGLLGPNGAGKTTIVRILTLLAKLTAGNAQINGLDIYTHAATVKKLIGVVPQHLNLDLDLTGRENLILQAKMHHLRDAEERKYKVDEVLAFIELASRADELCRTYSGGMKRRLMIGCALIHQPQVLFLDEPTVGLDPQVRRKIWDLIRVMNQSGMTVLLTTHYIEEAEQLCKRVAIMEQGRIIALDTPQDLRKKVGEVVVEWLAEEHTVSKIFSSREKATAFAGTLKGAATIRNANLEDVFIELTGRRVNE